MIRHLRRLLGRPVRVALVGRSGSGKTTLVEALTAELTRRGVRVGTMKHTHHRNCPVDQPGKDTWRHRQAGAETVILAAADQVAWFHARPVDWPPAKPPARLLIGLDVLLVEGFKEADCRIVTLGEVDTRYDPWLRLPRRCAEDSEVVASVADRIQRAVRLPSLLTGLPLSPGADVS
ncbi:MAG: molybdopterin-guanine dinucleotide biosynthesis protein B [Myxococcota bacterium]